MGFDLYEHVKGAASVGITGHIKPDGDCIGSTIGLMLYLRKRLPEARVELFLEKPEPAFDRIVYRDQIITDYPEREPMDVFIVCDTNYERIGGAKKYFDAAKKTINIDHHISNVNGTGMINYVLPDAAAAGEIVYGIIPKEYLDADIAASLYMAMAHDTGVFHFGNTSPDTMRAAADLMGYGFDFAKLLDDTFFACSMIQHKLISKVLLESRYYFHKQIIVGSVSLEAMGELGATKDDTGIVVERLRNTEHVEGAVFIYEKEPGYWKASLRSTSDLLNVAKVGEHFGGGGHVRAAGCEFWGTRQAFEEELVKQIGKQVDV